MLLGGELFQRPAAELLPGRVCADVLASFCYLRSFVRRLQEMKPPVALLLHFTLFNGPRLHVLLRPAAGRPAVSG